MERYLDFIEWIQDIEDWRSLKFCDEAHIIGKKLGPRKVLGLRSHRVYLKDDTLNSRHASLSIITSLTSMELIFIDYREESNTQWDFLDFVTDM